MKSHLKRREFLTVSAAALSAAFIPLTLSASRKPVDLSRMPETVGQSYLAAYPAERNLHWLESKLHFTTGASPEEILAQLRADILADYEARLTFRHGGWVFSLTEGRLCAFRTLV